MSTTKAQNILTEWKQLIIRYNKRSNKLFEQFNAEMQKARPRVQRKLILLCDNFNEVCDDLLNKTIMELDEAAADIENKMIVSLSFVNSFEHF